MAAALARDAKAACKATEIHILRTAEITEAAFARVVEDTVTTA